jgi:hypothetical protein
LAKKLPPFQEDVYSPTTSKYAIPPPPPTYFPIFDNFNLEPKFIFLKNNKIFHNNKNVSAEELNALIRPWIEENKVIFSLYDLESTYGHFLEMTAIIDAAYNQVREAHSKAKFNKSLIALIGDEYDEIKMEIRMYHIWSYSIPHYKGVVEKENSFFGLNVNSVEPTPNVE